MEVVMALCRVRTNIVLAEEGVGVCGRKGL